MVATHRAEAAHRREETAHETREAPHGRNDIVLPYRVHNVISTRHAELVEYEGNSVLAELPGIELELEHTDKRHRQGALQLRFVGEEAKRVADLIKTDGEVEVIIRPKRNPPLDHVSMQQTPENIARLVASSQQQR